MQGLPAAPDLGTSLRRFVYAAAGLAGAAVMIIEILGTRMLAPYLGTSHYVWTAQISVTLFSLTTGYYLGGRLVDRSPVLDWIFGGLVAAGVYLSLTTLLCSWLAERCARLDPAIGALLASFVLFFVPLTLLAMVGPFLTRMLASNVATVGGQVGRLSAVSTVGSFVGTILIGYVLLPLFFNSTIMFITALALGVVGVLYFVVWGKRRLVIMPIAMIGFALGKIGVGNERTTQFVGYHQLLTENSTFGLIQVIEKDHTQQRHYLTDRYPHNDHDAASKDGGGYYIYAVHELARAYAVRPIEDMLVIGMGVGTGPMYFAKHGAKVDIVEINPAAIPVAVQYCDFDPARFRIVIGDGRYFINEESKTYDCVVLDAFLGDAPPGHLMTKEAFQAIRRLLKPGAPLVINTNMVDFGSDFFSASLTKTLKSVFASVLFHRGGAVNKFFVATDREVLGPPAQHELEDDVPEAFRAVVMGTVNGGGLATASHGQVLLDDHNPLDVMDAENRQYLHRKFTSWFRTE